MLGKITLLSTYGFPYESVTESWLGGLDASTEYLINLDNAVKMKVSGTTDSFLEYKLNLKEDSSPKFNFIVDETNAQLVTLAEATPDSLMIELNVYEGALTFNDITGLSTTAIRYNISDIVWGSENEAGTCTRLVITEGGFAVKPIFVDHNIDQIIDLADTGTTTTTTSSTSSTSTTSTSSTSTTSTYTTSTSTTSTSSTSTSSTSTSSTSSTSTSSTSTSTSSTSTSSTSTTSTSTTSTSSTTTIA